MFTITKEIRDFCTTLKNIDLFDIRIRLEDSVVENTRCWWSITVLYNKNYRQQAASLLFIPHVPDKITTKETVEVVNLWLTELNKEGDHPYRFIQHLDYDEFKEYLER